MEDLTGELLFACANVACYIPQQRAVACAESQLMYGEETNESNILNKVGRLTQECSQLPSKVGEVFERKDNSVAMSMKPEQPPATNSERILNRPWKDWRETIRCRRNREDAIQDVPRRVQCLAYPLCQLLSRM